MSDIIVNLIGILYFLIALGVIVTVHEFGHLIVAKRNGVFCYEFAIGMGPKLVTLGKDKTGTVYTLRYIPIGGYVRLAGEGDDEEDQEIPEEQRFDTKNKWVKFKILVAGALMNFLLAFILLLVFVFFSGVTVQYFTSGGDSSFLMGKYDLFGSIVESFSFFWFLVVMMFQTLIGLFNSSVSVNDLTGPVGIATASIQVIKLGVLNMLMWVALLSMNIGVINLLPIPALDGGRILFLVIELIIGRDINKKAEVAINTTVFFLLIALMIYVTFNDVRGLTGM